MRRMSFECFSGVVASGQPTTVFSPGLIELAGFADKILIAVGNAYAGVDSPTLSLKVFGRSADRGAWHEISVLKGTGGNDYFMIGEIEKDGGFIGVIDIPGIQDLKFVASTSDEAYPIPVVIDVCFMTDRPH